MVIVDLLKGVVYMKFFIDTANVEEIKKVAKWGVLDGVTTNPTLIAREGRDLKEVIEEICSIVDGPISAEVISLESEKMVEEAKELIKIHKNIVIKVPMCEEGLKAVSELTKLGIKTNVTLIFSAQQALLAAKAGATYVSPFLGRIDDIGSFGIQLVEDIVTIFTNFGIESEIICASIRTPIHVLECARVGGDIATVPYKVFAQMLKHPLTDRGIEQFLEDYKSMNK
ncbi:translaldolase [Clostridium tetani]|nr:putative transaldolase [Clostridium tetani]BDR82645.1 putative transaldolase [Clostridium tetani]BDR85452.1 putative transaldolase [Clostridium tetani]SUY54251.1 translaldolase [Clostridium tetani]